MGRAARTITPKATILRAPVRCAAGFLTLVLIT